MVNAFLDEMSKEAKDIITTICDEMCILSDKVSYMSFNCLSNFVNLCLFLTLFLYTNVLQLASAKTLCTSHCSSCE